MFEAHFISFFIILLVAVIFTAFFSRLHIPWAIALILGGVVIGPSGFGLFTPDDTILFLSEIGLVFLMFMAGLEIRLDSLQQNFGKISGIAFINGFIPLIVGLLIGYFLGLGLITSLLIGIIFISSSVAVVIPSLEKNKLLGTKIGDVIIGSTMLQDIVSLVLLSVIFQTYSDLTFLPLPLFYILLALLLLILRKILPIIRLFFSHHKSFGQELRSVLFILVGVVAMFELLGLHQIIAGFFTGFVLSGSINNPVLKEKLHSVSYGLFIPVFFVVVGMNTDIGVFNDLGMILPIVSLIILGSVISKYTSGWVGSKMFGLTNYESNLVAITSIPQLSTTLAVAFSAITVGLISNEIVTSLVVLSIVTTMLAPFLTTYFLNNNPDKFPEKKKVEVES